MKTEKMKECKVCGELVAKNAHTCPHCGARLKHSSSVFIILLRFLLIPIVLFLLYAAYVRITWNRAVKETMDTYNAALEETMDTYNAAVEETIDAYSKAANEVTKSYTESINEINKALSGK